MLFLCWNVNVDVLNPFNLSICSNLHGCSSSCSRVSIRKLWLWCNLCVLIIFELLKCFLIGISLNIEPLNNLYLNFQNVVLFIIFLILDALIWYWSFNVGMAKRGDCAGRPAAKNHGADWPFQPANPH